MGTKRFQWLALSAAVMMSAMLAACGGGGGGSSGSGASATSSSHVPASWVGTWKSVNWVNADGTCDASYTKSSAAGGGTYYGAGFNSTLTMASNGTATNVESLYNDSHCTSLAGTLTTSYELTSPQAQTQSGYTDVETFVVTITSSTLSNGGGTGVSLAGIPASSGSTNERLGLNASGELCAGHGANDANGYPTFSGTYPPDLCSVKQ